MRDGTPSPPSLQTLSLLKGEAAPSVPCTCIPEHMQLPMQSAAVAASTFQLMAMDPVRLAEECFGRGYFQDMVLAGEVK